MKLVFCIFTLLFTICLAQTEFLVNHVAACTRDNTDMLCTTRDYDMNTQYHHIRNVSFCDYHYCVTTSESEHELVCSGYVYTINGLRLINPLTPNETLSIFAKNTDNYVYIDTIFRAYNVLLDSYRQNVKSTFKKPIENVYCPADNGYATCVEFNDGTKQCFGATYLKFFNLIESVAIGFGIQSSIAIAFYIIVQSIKLKPIPKAFVDVFIVPLLVLITAIIIVYRTEKIVVKIFLYILGAFIGVVFANISTNCIFNRCYSKVKFEDEEELKPLNRTIELNNVERSSSVDFTDVESNTEDV